MRHLILTIFVLYVLIAGVFSAVKGYQIYRDTDALIDRAQVAADREDMLEYIEQLKSNMEKWGLTKGYTALIFKSSISDMSQHYKTVNRYIERLEGIKDVPKSDTTYQVALNDLRGAIRELPNPAAGWFWVHYGWWLLVIGIVLLFLVIVVWWDEIY